MTHYVAGVLFNEERTRCVLIEKKRPAWQAGFLNAVGGHVEQDEESIEAMRREFREETGMLHTVPWEYAFQIISGPSNIRFYRAFMPMRYLDMCRTVTDETIRICTTVILPANVIPNKRWIVPLLMAHGVEPFVVHEQLRGGFPPKETV